MVWMGICRITSFSGASLITEQASAAAAITACGLQIPAIVFQNMPWKYACIISGTTINAKDIPTTATVLCCTGVNAGALAGQPVPRRYPLKYR